MASLHIDRQLCNVCVCAHKNKWSANMRCLENTRGGQQSSDTNHIQQPDMSQVWNNEQTDKQTVIVSLWFFSPHLFDAQQPVIGLLYVPVHRRNRVHLDCCLFLSTWKPLKFFSLKNGQTKRGVCQAERKTGEHFSTNLWSSHTLNKALKDTESSDDISVVGEEEPSPPSFMLIVLLWHSSQFLTSKAQPWSS